METPSLKYLQVADYLREQISRGVWKIGDRLPSHTEARAHFSCTQHTIERAHAVLEKDGLIERRHRQGIFVTASSPVFAQERKTSAIGVSVTENWVSDTIAVASFYGHDGVLAHESGWESSIVQGALSMAQREDMHALLLHPSRLLPNKIASLNRHPPAGIVLSLSSFESQQAQQIRLGLNETSIPVVVYGNIREFSAYDCVISDHVAGARKLTRYLLDRGCRQIVNLQFEDNKTLAYWQPERQAGYAEAMQEAGLRPLPVCRIQKLAETEEPSEIQFFNVVTHLVPLLRAYFQKHPDCDALLVESDGLVRHVVAACRFLGIEVGRDLLVAGYDNYWHRLGHDVFESSRPIATVDKHNARLGSAAVRLLLDRIRGVLPPAPQRRVIEPELIVPDENNMEPKTRLGMSIMAPATTALR